MKTENKTRKTKKQGFITINENINKDKINRELFWGSINLKIEPLDYQRKMRNEWK